MDSWRGAEQRDSERISTTASVFLKFNGRLFGGFLKNVSTRSICVEMKDQLPVGLPVDVVIMHAAKSITMKGDIEFVRGGQVVVTTGAKSSGALMGLFNALNAG